MKNKLIPKHLNSGKILINEPASESTYRTQPQLNINEQELLNFIQSNPDVEDLMMREYAVKHSTFPTSNQGVIVEAKKDNAKNNFFRGYNNFRYSHPWAKGLNWTPIIGDIMDGVSLAGDINNKDYMTAGLGLGMLTLPNFILKPLLKVGSYEKINMLKKVKNKTWDKHYSKALLENDMQEARRLFDLHLKAKTPKGYQNTILYHGSRFGNIPYIIYPKSPTRKTYGFYMSPDKNYATGYLKSLGGASINKTTEPIELTLTYKNMYTFPDYNSGYAINSLLYKNIINLGYDSGITFYKNKIPEYIAFNPNLIKSNDLITYNNSNKVIPLSKRHDFNKPDIRYSWLIPTVPFGVMSYKLSKQNEQNLYKKGGKLKSKKNIKKCEKGTTQGGLIKRSAKFIYGLTLPEYKGTFNEAFRQARINGDEKFKWNGELYNTNLKLDEILEALKLWDTKGDLGKEEFKNQAIRNNKAFHDFYSKTYKTNYNNKNFDKLYDAALFYDRNAQRTTDMELGSMIYSSLIDTWDEDKVAAVMGNTYKETGGWVNLKQNNGPGEGLFLMENAELNRYKNWLNTNKLIASRANEVMYVKLLFDSKSPLLNTPWTNLDDPYTINEINNQLKINNKPLITNGDEARAFVKTLKSKEEADKYKVGCAWQHQDYSTEEAWHDWEYGDLDAKTKAFEALYEKAGKPDMDERYYMAHLIKKNQHIFK